MKRILILLITILLPKIFCFSQTTSSLINPDSTVSITTSDLKYANFIFAEHNKLLLENDLLYQQIDNLNTLNSNLVQVDSLRQLQYSELNTMYLNTQNELKKSKRASIGWEVGGITVGIGLLMVIGWILAK